MVTNLKPHGSGEPESSEVPPGAVRTDRTEEWKIDLGRQFPYLGMSG